MQGCLALRILDAKNAENKAAIRRAGGVEVVEAAMRAHPGNAKVQEEGRDALGRLLLL